ncbi:MAG: ADP-ribosylglycohydrolase family protein [Anaerolineae bacterium]|nr:ADP-ribosylglycohydrolase family protein [Anaerolineae bacterium]
MSLPDNYVERTYAGVLGKLIGVYLGRPFEQWSHERIMAELGEIHYYVHDRLNKPLIVTDDDIAGTFTFLRALPDYGNRRDITSRQIGQSWLNYLIENRTILWWGGLGNSTEHTAYLRLKRGIPAPASGSAALNTQTVAAQIGAQIFIDGWAMVAPGNPELAANLARRAASVSHDGDAVHAAQIIAVMESLAYIESDAGQLLDAALAFIPRNTVIQRMIADVREWHSQFPDWRDTRRQIAAHYGYDKFGGVCHVIPNHALIILGLLYGAEDFQKAMTIVNTSGWDTDCNAGNLGCLLGIKNGLAAFTHGVDWRGPIADRLYLSTADGGRAITDALAETYHIVNIGRALAGQLPLHPKGGSRFHFEMPGSMQGFTASSAGISLQNVAGHSLRGARSLAINFDHLAAEQSISTPTFIPPDAINMPGYALHASPTLYSGQQMRARFSTDANNTAAMSCRLFIQTYAAENQLATAYHQPQILQAGNAAEITWVVPDTGGAPIVAVGLAVVPQTETAKGVVYLDELTWDGSPHTTLKQPESGGKMWRRAWVNGMDHFDEFWPETYRVIQDQGTGLLMQGARDWQDYRVSSTIIPHLIEAAGIAARVQGMRRYYALMLVRENRVCLLKALDGEIILAEAAFEWHPEQPYALKIEVEGNQIRCWIDDNLLFTVTDIERPLNGGGVALVCTEGMLLTDAVTIAPLKPAD